MTLAPTDGSGPRRKSFVSLAAGLVLQVVVISLITIALLESLVALSFRYPRWSPIPESLVKYLHIRFDRNVIQVMPECAVYDDTLTYRLKPGRCTFASREFSNEYQINSLGVRDDEQSLNAPQTVILGDSFAMGWGVDQEQSFPAVFERLSGWRTLNAGISSYGTVRELRLLERIDRTALKNLVIQYNPNDALENRQLVERPPFKTLSREHYERTVLDQQGLLRYYPGRYAFNVLVQLQSMIRGRASEPGDDILDYDKQAQLFLGALARSPVSLASYRVTLLAVDSKFIDSVKRALPASADPSVKQLELLDVGSIASIEAAYYTLDDHPTAIGHEAVARLLLRHLQAGSSLNAASQQRD